MRSKLPVLLTVCAAVLAINLDTTIVNVALPSISTDLDAGTRSLQWIVDAYNLAFAALVLAAGSLSDRYGRRPALILGLLGFAAASMVGAVVDSAGALIAARFAMGAAAAVIFPTTLSIISNTFRDRRERAAALGVWGAVVGIGVAAGPVVGGLLLEHFAWGSVFWALAPLALVTAVAAYVLVPESRDPSVPALDLPGLGLSIAMLGTLVYTIIEAPEHGWGSAQTVGGFVLSAVLLLVFVMVERRAAHPDARPRPVPRPPLQRGERGGHGDVLRPVRVHLPDHAVLPVRPWVRRPVDRRAHPPRRPEHRRCLGGRRDAGAADRHQGGRHQRAAAVRHRRSCGSPPWPSTRRTRP